MIRVLLADDQAPVREGLRVMLDAQSDITVVAEARTGEEALAAARSLRPDVVIMDVRMPGMDGLTATQTIRALGGTKGATPIVAVTAEAMPEQVRKCLAFGMDAHVAKPIRPDVLYAVIEEVLNREPEAAKAAG